MSARREAQIVGITTDIQQLKLCISAYDTAAQKFIRDFCDIFTGITTQPSLPAQTGLIKSLKQFDTQYRFSKNYYEIAFLWFACDFVNLIHKQLILGHESLGFIHKILREVHHFIEKPISLKRVPEWEKVQYACNQSIIPLLHTHYKNELQILVQLQFLIDKYKLGSLNPKRIRNAVRPALRGPPWKPTQQIQIRSFFDLSQVVWDLHFYPPAFKLSRIFVSLKINKPERFKEYQRDFSGSETQVCRTYLVLEGSQESFIVWLVIPVGLYIDFVNFLQDGEEEGILEIVECQEVVDFKHSVSYAFYKAGLGWSFQTNEFKNIHTKKQPLQHIDPHLFETLITTRKWNTRWSFLKFQKTEQLIETFCKYWGAFTYEDLCKFVGQVKLNQDRTKLLEPYNRCLRELIDKRVLQIMITPWGLLRSYSFDYYLVKPPRTVSREDIKKFLTILPYALSYELNNRQVRIFCLLDDTLADFISHNMKWGLISLKPESFHSNLNKSLFSFDSCTWKKPQFLEGEKLGRLIF